MNFKIKVNDETVSVSINASNSIDGNNVSITYILEFDNVVTGNYETKIIIDAVSGELSIKTPSLLHIEEHVSCAIKCGVKAITRGLIDCWRHRPNRKDLISCFTAKELEIMPDIVSCLSGCLVK